MVTLRGYQLRTISQLVSAYKRGSNGVVVCVPVGGGKTITAATYVVQWIKDGGRVIWVCHRKELLDQAAEAFRRIGFTDFVICQNTPKKMINSPLVICGIKKIERSEITVNDPTLVVIDEAHRAPSKSYLDAISRWQSTAKFLGLSATPSRDGMSNIFDEILHPVHISELIEANVLVPARIVGAEERTRVSFDDSTGGESWEPIVYFRKYCVGKQTIIYTVDGSHNKKIVDEFKKIDVEVVSLSAKTPLAERERILKGFHQKKIKIIVNNMILTEGFDSDVDCIILTRPCLDAKTYNQICGRAMRKSRPDKTECWIIDLTGAVIDHGSPDSDQWHSIFSTSKKKDCPNCGAQLERSDWLLRRVIGCEWCEKTDGIHPHCPNPKCGFHYEIPSEGRSPGLKPHQKKQFPPTIVDLVDAILTRAPVMVRNARALDAALKKPYEHDSAVAWQEKNLSKDSETIRKATYFALVALRERINEERIKKRMQPYKARFPAAVYNAWYGDYPPNTWDGEIT